MCPRRCFNCDGTAAANRARELLGAPKRNRKRLYDLRRAWKAHSVEESKRRKEWVPGQPLVLLSPFTTDMVLVRAKSVPARVAKYNVALRERSLWAVRAEHEILSSMVS